VELLARLLPKTVNVFPSLDAIGKIQDRKSQKRLLDEFKIPTSPWVIIESKADLETAREKLGALVLKKRRFGYDGYGTFVMKDKLDFSPLEKSEHGFIAEKWVPFKRELAISFVRSGKGDFLALPLVESVQENSRCFSVMGPVKHKGISALTQKFKNLMNKMDYVGILAVELFETKGALSVNELAPRVHNSAHYSQDGLTTSQFVYHLSAGLDFKMPKPELTRPGFAMVNLLGSGNPNTGLSHSGPGHLHWYGKSENREGRKLGHINVLGGNPKQALQQAIRWRKDFKI
jgi:5-(carboxyamino)imidazole ribonucleotide synthase